MSEETTDRPDGNTPPETPLETPREDAPFRPIYGPALTTQRPSTRLILFPKLPTLNPRLRRGLLGTTLAGLATAYLGAMSVLGYVVTTTQDIPEVSVLAERSRPVSITFEDRYGREMLVRGGNAAGHIKITELPDHVRHAVMAVEDERFTAHIGIDAEGIARAFVTNLRSGRRGQGGSTLTQQLVKNVFLTPEKTYRRKVQEALLALWLEREYTKDEVMEMYLERVYFGSGNWGLPAAAQTYFGLEPHELSLGQTAMLIGLLRAPSAYNPLNDPEKAGARAAIVLAKMEERRFIDRAQRAEALAMPLSIRPPNSQRGVNYFADWIWPEIETTLGTLTTDITVRTTLDADIQAASEISIATHLDPDRGAEQAAIVTLDRAGGVISMVGGASYADSQFNRATQAIRQPGSSFKPFVYLTALESGITPWDLRLDAPIDIDGWEPKNFRDKYYGLVTLEDAFGKSLNTVAVRLSEEVRPERVVATAARFGLTDLQPLRSIGLGAQGATPLQMSAAYLPFGNWGESYAPFGILSITTDDALPLYTAPPRPGTKVIARDTLADMNRLMTRTVQMGTGTRARVPGRAIAGKTGTTNESRDAWFVGVAPGFSTAVWVGNDANTPMKNITGGSIPARIFSDVMTATLADQPVTELPVSSTPIYADPTERSLDTLLTQLESALH
jgi:penicillin-binding protein 1A